MKTTKKYNKQKNKKSIVNYIENAINDYDFEIQNIYKDNFCVRCLCDGDLPIVLINNVPNDLLYCVIK